MAYRRQRGRFKRRGGRRRGYSFRRSSSRRRNRPLRIGVRM